MKLAAVQSSHSSSQGSTSPNQTRQRRTNEPTSQQPNKQTAQEQGGEGETAKKGSDIARQTKKQNKFSRQRRWTLEDKTVRDVSRTSESLQQNHMIEAYVNSVQKAVKRQLSLSQQLRKELSRIPPTRKECWLGAINTPVSKPAIMHTLPIWHNQAARPSE